jgi:hypothetical protein
MVYKRSEKWPKEVKKRGNLIEKQKAHEKMLTQKLQQM